MEGVSLRRRLVALVAAGMVAAGGLASSAAMAATRKPTAYLVVSSTGSASGVITVNQTIQAGDPFDDFPATFSGQYAGYLLSSLDGKPLIGRIHVRGVGFDAAHDVTPLWFAMKNLPPGRYRITVIGTGPTTVSIPIGGHRSRHVGLTGKARTFASVVGPTTPDVDPAGTPVANFGVPVPAGHYELGTVVRFGRGSFTQADVGDECFTTSPTCATEGSVASDGFFVIGNTGEGAFSSGSSTTPMDLGAGMSAVFDGVDAGLSSHQAGLVVLISAPTTAERDVHSGSGSGKPGRTSRSI